MSRVDPFLYPIPKELQIDAEVRAYFEYLNRFLHDIWARTGGGDDQVANASIEELYPWTPSADSDSSIANLFNNRRAIQQDALSLFAATLKFDKLDIVELKAADTAFTTTGSQIIVCNNTDSALITLRADPDDLEEIQIEKKNGPVRFQSSAGINGKTTEFIILDLKGSPRIRFYGVAGEWSII